ncbi:hypothetical protein D3C84_1138580 [compost metagenome]
MQVLPLPSVLIYLAAVLSLKSLGVSRWIGTQQLIDRGDSDLKLFTKLLFRNPLSQFC